MPSVTVETARYDGRLVRRWVAHRLSSVAGETRLAVPFGTVFTTATGTWAPRTAAIYHYWPDRWHDVITVADAAGDVLGLYCNIQTPPVDHGNLITTTDLDLDVWVNSDFTYRVMDRDEFEENRCALGYPSELVVSAERALDGLIGAIERRDGMFADRQLFAIDPAAERMMRQPVEAQ